MSKKLASLFALDINKCEEIGELAKIHIENIDKLHFNDKYFQLCYNPPT